jgi:hypothetical protein
VRIGRNLEGDILTSAAAETLTNSTGLPFFVNMTCLNGYFQSPYADSLAEALFKFKHGGAVAVWTSLGLTVPNEQAPMNHELINNWGLFYYLARPCGDSGDKRIDVESKDLFQ